MIKDVIGLILFSLCDLPTRAGPKVHEYGECMLDTHVQGLASVTTGEVGNPFLS